MKTMSGIVEYQKVVRSRRMDRFLDTVLNAHAGRQAVDQINPMYFRIWEHLIENGRKGFCVGFGVVDPWDLAIFSGLIVFDSNNDGRHLPAVFEQGRRLCWT